MNRNIIKTIVLTTGCLVLGITSFGGNLIRQTFHYDAAGRLIEVQSEGAPELNEAYRYDASGNIIEKRQGRERIEMTYDKANQLTSRTDSDGTVEFVYDSAGRLIEEWQGETLLVSYEYGYLDKVISVTRGDQVTRFHYNARGMLVGKERNGQMIETLGWDGIGLLAKGDTVYANEAHISGGTPLVSIDSGGKSTYFDHDYLGTTTATYSEDGATDVHLTGSLGRGSETSNVRFTGKPYDEDLGAHVFPFRNYRSDAGRWTSADPAGFPDGPNQHFYAPVPTTGLDPWGLYESGDTRWIHGEYTITGTWTERFEAGVSGGAIGLSFGGPSISVSFGAGWTMVDGSDSYPQTAGEQGGEVTAPNGWDWVPETIVNYNHDPQATEYGEVYTEGGYYVNVAQPDVPLDGVPLDLVGPGPNEYDYIPKITLKDSTKDVIFYWKRQAIEL